MSTVTTDAVRSMDYGFEGVPFVSTAKSLTVLIQSMDYSFEGIPFVVNSETESVTTEIELTTESIAVEVTTNAFNTTSILSEEITVVDVLSGYNVTSGLSETITLSDSMGALAVICNLGTENITVTDDTNASPIIPLSINESIVFAETEAYWAFPQELLETIVFVEESFGPIVQFSTITDLLNIYDDSQPGWSVTADDILSLIDTHAVILGISTEDWLTLIDTESNNWNGREIVPDGLTIYDICGLGGVYDKTVDESILIADDISYQLTLTILEYLGFTELANAVRTSRDSVNDSLVLDDLIDRGYALAIEDVLMAVDATSIIARFLDALQESLILTDVSEVFKRIANTLTESISFAETVTTHGHLYSVVYESLMMNIRVELNNEVYECYVLNTPKMLPSVYSGFNFNSYCVFENRAFGANSTGIYELTGNSDGGDTIHTGVILSSTDFNAPNQKRFRKGYLGITGDQTVMVFEGEDGTRKAYNVNTDGKMMASHSLKSKTWELSVVDFESLNYMKLIPIILTK